MTYVRKPHKKTKTGCTSCKRRRIKCDETKPVCLRCQKRKLDCLYLPPNGNNTPLSLKEESNSDTSIEQPVSTSIPNAQNVYSEYQYPQRKQPPLHDPQHAQYLNLPFAPDTSSFSNFTPPFITSEQGESSSIYNQHASTPISQYYKMTLEPTSYIKSSTVKPSKMLNNKFESLGADIFYKMKHTRQTHPEPMKLRNNIHLPLTQITPPSNSEEVDKFFENVETKKNLDLDKDKFTHSVRLPLHAVNEDIGKVFNPMFLTPNFDLSYLSNLHINNQFLSYACYMELTWKLQKYTLNNLPFKVSKDKFSIEIFMVCLESAPLYESLYHVFGALSFISLYHENWNNGGRDDYFNFDPEVYLTLSDYHFSRSIQSMNLDVNLIETKRRLCCLYMTVVFQILSSLLQPSQKICSRNFLMIYKNMEFIGDFFHDCFEDCTVFNQVIERALLVDYSRSPDIYSPIFLSGLENIVYLENDGTNRIKAKTLNEAEKDSINLMVTQLDMVYKGLRNKTDFDKRANSGENDPESVWYKSFDKCGLNGEIIEDDCFIIVQRLFYRVPDTFINLVSMGDPRALIIIGYAVMLLASKTIDVVKTEHFKTEFQFILGRLDRLQNSNKWKGWLTTVMAYFN